MSSLGGWTRLGIVTSVLWILIAGFLSQSANVNQALYLRGIEMRSCVETTYAKGSRDLTLCEKQAGELYDAYMHNRWVDTAIIAFAPHPVRVVHGLAHRCSDTVGATRISSAELTSDTQIVRY